MKLIRLHEDAGSVLLLCEEAVASKAMNELPQATDFRESSLYTWLNGEFAEQNLTDEERSRLIEVTLLSAEEAGRFFPSEDERGCRPDANAVREGVRVGGNGNCWWWLRSKGFAEDFFEIVDFAGHVCTQGTYVTLNSNGVRPAIWLRKE